jgi:hypothetical protein
MLFVDHRFQKPPEEVKFLIRCAPHQARYRLFQPCSIIHSIAPSSFVRVG